MWGIKKKKRIYLDYAATTPVRGEVFDVMKPYFSELYGNASSIHKEGVIARDAVEEARVKAGRTLRVRPEQVIFTSGGTESNNIALMGTVEKLHVDGMMYSDIEIISTKVEHPSILAVLSKLEQIGVCVTYTPIDDEGRVIFPEFTKLLNEKTKLVTIAYANSETGVVQDINRLGRSIKAYAKESDVKILFHTDASQAPLWLPCALDALSVDMMTLDAGKCYGPKGVGILVNRVSDALEWVTYGGSQEFGVRPGTENVPLIVGCAEALVIAQDDWESRSEAVASLRDSFIATLEKIEGVQVNGSKQHRLANNVNISIPGLDTEFAVITLDSQGIACSTKSACSGADSGMSYVVFKMTHDVKRAESTIRFSLGEDTTLKDLSCVVEVLTTHISKTRAFQSHINTP